jgi:hypothetical protein
MSPDILDACQSHGLPAKTVLLLQCGASCIGSQTPIITVQMLFPYMVIYTVYAALENRKISFNGVCADGNSGTSAVCYDGGDAHATASRRSVSADLSVLPPVSLNQPARQERQ